MNSLVLTTVSAEDQPSSRVVLLKEYTDSEFIFYTNYQSRKGLEIAQNPAVALLFWWEDQERQIRIEGIASKIPAEQSDYYFHSRPKLSQIAAAVSQQSEPIPPGEELHTHFKELCAEYASAEAIVPRPLHWGGYRVVPKRFEYWQGRENRLHDRFVYTLDALKKWQITKLYP